MKAQPYKYSIEIYYFGFLSDTITFFIVLREAHFRCEDANKKENIPCDIFSFYLLNKLAYLVASIACLINWKVLSGSLSKPTEKRIRPSLIPISF